MAGIVAIAGGALALGLWAYRTDYQVLFADVAPRDAAAMTAELDRMKTPYQLSDGGNTILVPKDLVYKTRLKLMGKDLPLHGAVGFEVFNNADFGMTEFVQKVNYLRAVQGELTRTILSIDDIQAARVHLAIPEQGLFKKTLTKPKGSVTVTMKQGRVLGAEQVAGIQRLVAASVPDIVSGDVTVLDQHGLALTRPASDTGESAVAQLDSKRSTEDYLLKKVTQVLDRTFGAGEAIASVDVLLNLDQSKVTTEEVLPARVAHPDDNPAGVIVRARQVTHDGAAVSDASSGLAGKSGGANGNTTTESDYQVGRRIEQVAVASGAVRRMTIAVLVKPSLNDAQIEKLKEVVGLAVGFNTQRGDAVVVSSIGQFVGAAQAASAAGAPAVEGGAAQTPAAPASAVADVVVRQQPAVTVLSVLLGLLALAAVGVVLFVLGARGKRSARKRLNAAERAQMLDDVRQWIAAPAAAGKTGGVRK